MHRSPSHKSALAFAAAMLAAACLLFLFDLRTCPIQPDRSNLTDCIADRYRQSFHFDPSYEPKVELYDSLTFGRETLVLFDIGGSLGRAVLEENILGWYKISSFGYGGGSFRYGSWESDGTQYLVFGGRNPLQEIAGADFRIDGTVYHLDIPPPRSWSAHRFSIPDGMEPWTSVSSRFTTARARISQTAIISAAAAFNHISDPTEKSGDA